MKKNIKLIPDVSEATFEKEVLQSDKPVVVSIWTKWCGMRYEELLLPWYKEIDNELEHIKFVKINADENIKLVENLGIDKLPWLVLFNKGEKCEPTFPGHKYSWEIKEWLEKLI